MAKSITRIDAKKPDLLQRKRVAAYARVSMDTERLMHSLSVQVSYYSELIQNTPGWEYAGVYADEGITGTKMDSRPEFIRMLADCEAGKIDIILTKSLSRFARNTVDTLNVVRRLKELGIEVRFEKERINSLADEGELLITIMASFAQEEVRSLSENVKWGLRKRFEQGMPNGRFHVYGYCAECKQPMENSCTGGSGSHHACGPNDRFCPVCGQPTLFQEAGFLPDYTSTETYRMLRDAETGTHMRGVVQILIMPDGTTQLLKQEAYEWQSSVSSPQERQD